MHVRKITGTAAASLFWLGVYLLLILAPLVLLMFGGRPRPGGFWWDFALALGYAGLGMIGVQFALTARFRHATSPFGIDIIYYFHRFLATGAFLLLLLHAGILLLRYPATIGGWNPFAAPLYMSLAWLGLFAFAVLVVSSLWRKRFGIEYDRWRRWHVTLAVVGLSAALVHVHGSGSYLSTPTDRVLWSALGAFWLGLFAYVRIYRPFRLRRRPWRVSSVRPECTGTWTLELAPESGQPFHYRPGQFAWLSLRASPFAMREHPFSFSSTPTRPGQVAFTIKELGDFTSRIGEIQPGELAYVDGPYGSFGIDRHPDANGYVFIAGGVGIAPLISMLRALADRGDSRPKWLFYGNRVLQRVVFREEIDALAADIGLNVQHVLLEPPDGWSGETGYIDRDVLARHLPEQRVGFQYYVCGPSPMIRLAEQALTELGVPLRNIHSEIFDLA